MPNKPGNFTIEPRMVKEAARPRRRFGWEGEAMTPFPGTPEGVPDGQVAKAPGLTHPPDCPPPHLPVQAHAFLELLEEAGLLRISWEHLAHCGPLETAQRLHNAAASFCLGSGDPLDACLSTNPNDIWRARSSPLAPRPAPASLAHLPRFLCTYAADAGPRSLFWQGTGPLQIDEDLDGDFAQGGPYLVLLHCQREWSGRLRLGGGYAQPVLSASVPFPVRFAAERETLAVLLTLCERLDAQGLDLRLARSIGPAGLCETIRIEILAGNAHILKAAITCTEHAPACPDGNLLHVTPRSLENGSLLSWLSAQMQR